MPETTSFGHVVALAGGVGGAKLAHGLAQALPAAALTVIVNTGDDFEHLGLPISPDLDTVMYTLAGLANPVTGWGQVGESWNFLAALQRLGGPAWFQLGDRDLATHLERRRRLAAGATLTQTTAALCRALGVGPAVLPMTDDPLRTLVQTDAGELEFQEYFVHRQCAPRVNGFRFAGAETAQPTPSVLAALDAADLIVLCPSNPFVSLGPILLLPGVSTRLAARPTLAVSPIVGGKALKGPAAKMLDELGLDVSALAVARRYAEAGVLRAFVLDHVDAALVPDVRALGLLTLVADTVMSTEADRARLAHEVLAFAAQPLVAG
ncbi:MAG: 2-phospho-L-lactate transferase [Anaerolineales bacterium]|nr:2-phospho-L-lactate transferase [Anaerolineales bacterium]